MSDVRPFEEYKEMIKDMKKEEMIRGLYDLSARVTKQENIINEVREYMALNIRVKLNEEFGETMQYKTIYEMLDEEKV